MARLAPESKIIGKHAAIPPRIIADGGIEIGCSIYWHDPRLFDFLYRLWHVCIDHALMELFELLSVRVELSPASSFLKQTVQPYNTGYPSFRRLMSAGIKIWISLGPSFLNSGCEAT
jgi:hypothetical protein